MGSVFSFIDRNIKTSYIPPEAENRQGALRCGILGAARIAPSAIILPAKSHPDFVITAVASRDKQKADDFARKYNIAKTYGDYQDLLDDPDIDVVYNPLPNGLHFEWSMKALKAGKHVLLEKPITNTEEEAKLLFEYAERKELVVLEAIHSRFHPAIHRMKEIVDSNELGKLKSVSANLSFPAQLQVIPHDDIRFKYDLGGGAMMDLGCYVLTMDRFISGADPTSIISAKADLIPNPKDEPQKRNIDVGAIAVLEFPNDVTGSLFCHFFRPGWGPFGLLPYLPDFSITAWCEGGAVSLNNYIFPHFYHSIAVTPTKGEGRVEKAYTYEDLGQPWWSTYRYQLEFFVDKIRGRKPRVWIEPEDSVSNMRWIDKVYETSGLGLRPKSDFSLSD